MYNFLIIYISYLICLLLSTSQQCEGNTRALIEWINGKLSSTSPGEHSSSSQPLPTFALYIKRSKTCLRILTSVRPSSAFSYHFVLLCPALFISFFTLTLILPLILHFYSSFLGVWEIACPALSMLARRQSCRKQFIALGGVEHVSGALTRLGTHCVS
jgi:hypothetical protein